MHFFNQNCRNSTTGNNCERCLPGYSGDATQGTSTDCIPDFEEKCNQAGTLRTDGRTCTCKVI